MKKKLIYRNRKIGNALCGVVWVKALLAYHEPKDRELVKLDLSLCNRTAGNSMVVDWGAGGEEGGRGGGGGGGEGGSESGDEVMIA